MLYYLQLRKCKWVREKSCRVSDRPGSGFIVLDGSFFRRYHPNRVHKFFLRCSRVSPRTASGLRAAEVTSRYRDYRHPLHSMLNFHTICIPAPLGRRTRTDSHQFAPRASRQAVIVVFSRPEYSNPRLTLQALWVCC